MSTSRRDFLRASACTLGGLALASTVESLGLVGAYAQAATDYRALVCVFLNGGNDGTRLDCASASDEGPHTLAYAANSASSGTIMLVPSLPPWRKTQTSAR